jgi:hypothetical protein
MMPATQQHQIAQIRAASIDPMPHMMSLQPADPSATRMGTPTITQHQRPELPIGDHPMGTTQVPHIPAPDSTLPMHNGTDTTTT